MAAQASYCHTLFVVFRKQVHVRLLLIVWSWEGVYCAIYTKYLLFSLDVAIFCEHPLL